MGTDCTEAAPGRVLVAMSGGVDSSVAALLLKREGWDCRGATMKLYANEAVGADQKTCCSLADIADACEVCNRLRIPYGTFDFTELFARRVIDGFVAAYEAGRTPNPCVECNRLLKFGGLFEVADRLGCSHVATGHYARVTREPDGTYRLRTAADASKDQTYFLFGLSQRQLARVLFPLGDLLKARDVRPLAEREGLVTAEKPDSQGICFVPGGDHLAFIEHWTGRTQAPGDIVDGSGRVLGRHGGAIRYTVGQRKGLGVGGQGEPLYVTRVDPQENRVVVGRAEELYAGGLVAGSWHWSAPVGSLPGAGEAGSSFRCRAKVRYHQSARPCEARLLDGGRVRLRFDEPQRAIAPGQAVVLYGGDVVLGGGAIEAAED